MDSSPVRIFSLLREEEGQWQFLGPQKGNVAQSSNYKEDLQVLGSVEEQQGAKGANVSGKTAQAFFCIIFMMDSGGNWNREVLQLLLQNSSNI